MSGRSFDQHLEIACNIAVSFVAFIVIALITSWVVLHVGKCSPLGAELADLDCLAGCEQ